MRRIIVPIDFSETSLNAARFISKMVAGQKETQILLYHNYAHDNDYEISKSYMDALKQELLEKGDLSVAYELEKGGELVDNIDKLAHSHRATLVAMGIRGRTELQQKYIGSNTLRTVDRNLYPVMIIPPDADFTKINNVAFACDFIDVENSTPTTLINAVLELFNPRLHIVNVNPNHYISANAACQFEQEKLKKMFSKYELEFHFITMYNFHDAIDSFLADFNIEMLITIPHHHTGSSGLWASSNTRKLAYHSHIPILTAHQ